MDSCTRGFPYSPLSVSEIRLIAIEPGKLDDPIECSLENVPLEDRPEYIALSYVWGDTSDTKQVKINKQAFSVTRNLYFALRQMREYVTSNELRELFNDCHKCWFWVDAICINQANLDEKSKQVPRMKDIYGSALRVFAWLGLNEEVEDRMVKMVFEKANDVGSHEKAGDMNWVRSYPLAQELGDDYEPFTRAFTNIITRPWFSRIWVIQEAVLAHDDPIFIVGGHSSTALLTIWLILRACAGVFLEPTLMANVGLIKIQMLRSQNRSLISHQTSTFLGVAPFARRLNETMRQTTLGYQSTLPHDMIYGIFGLTYAPELPAHLAPDYQKPFQEVYHKYAMLLIEHTGDLTVVSQFENHLTGVPSWVPDFRYHRTRPERPAISASVSFSSDGRVVKVEGIELGPCISIYQPESDGSSTPFSTILCRFEDVILGPACDLRNSPFNVILSEWLEDIIEPEDRDLSAVTMRALYSLFIKEARLNTEEVEEALLGKEIRKELIVKIHARLQTVLGIYPHVLAGDGTIGRLNRVDAEALQGDIVCIFKGSCDASLLRPCGDRYVFVSSCRLQCGLSREVFDEQFFSRRKLKTFVLI